MDYCKEIRDIIQQKQEEVFKLSDCIWDLAEPGLTETASAKAYIELLESEGFEVSKPIDYIPTAFLAKYGSGKPVIGITGEYDSLPGFSQKAFSFKKEPSTENPSAGHACGHNLLGVGALTGALVVKEYLKAHNMPGTVIFAGTPSEERDACKAFMARDGAFDDFDVAFTWHPESKTQAWNFGTLANVIAKFNFSGTAAHAAGSPERGRSALDAAELMNVGVNFLREHIISSARVHYAFTDVGGNAPNVVQASSSLLYFIRAPKLKDSMSIYERIKKIARGAAEMTETSVTEEFQLAVSDFMPNKVLTKLMFDSANELGAPEYTEEECRIARTYFDTLTDADKDATIDVYRHNFDEETCKEIFDKGICNHVFPFDEHLPVLSISTDVGDLSYRVPTGQMLVAAESLGTSLHSWQMASQGKGSMAKKGMLYAAEIIALSGIKVLNDPSIADAAKKEWNTEFPDGYKSPLPADLKVREV